MQHRPTFVLIFCIVLASTCFCTSASAAVEPPTFNVPRLDTPPEIDGKLTDDVWDHAAAMTGIVGRGFKLSPRQGVFMLGWDAEHLYYGVRSIIEPGDNLAPTGGASAADTVEFCLFPMGRDKPGSDAPERGYQLIFGSTGLSLSKVFYPRVMQNDPTPWKPTVRFADRVIEDPAQTFGPGTRLWEVEIAIPRKGLNLPRPNRAGDPWRLHFVRNYANPRAQLPIPVTKGFFNPDGFPRVTLTDGKPVVRLTDVTPLLRGLVKPVLVLDNTHGTRPAALAVTSRLETPKGQALSTDTKTVRLVQGKTGLIDELPVTLPDGWHKTEPVLNLVVTDGDEVVFSWSARLTRSIALMRAAQRTGRPALGELAVNVKHLVYGRYPHGTYYVDKNGTETKLTGMCGPGTRPRLSPDARHVAMMSTWGGKPGIQVIDIETRKSRRLCDGRDPAWLDDKTLVCSAGGRIVTVKLDEGEPAPVVRQMAGRSSLPAVDHNARKVYFVQRRDGQDDTVYVADVAEAVSEAAAVIGRLGRIDGLRFYEDSGALGIIVDGSVHVVAVRGGRPAWHNELALPGRVGDVLAINEGRAAVAAVGPHRPGRVSLYAGLPGAPGTWKLIKEGIDRQVDIRVEMTYAEPDKTDPGSLQVSREGEVRKVSFGRGGFSARLIDARAEPVRFGPAVVRLKDTPSIMVTSALSGIIVPDRLGDDRVLVLPLAEPVVVPARAVLLYLPDGKMVAVGAEGKGIRLRSIGRGVSLEAVDGSFTVMGRVDGTIGRPGGGWIAPYDAVWRVAAVKDADARMVDQAGEGLVDELDKALGVGAAAVAYPMLRRVETDISHWTVGDVLAVGGVSDDRRVLGFRVADKPTVWPTVTTTAEAIEQAYRLRWNTRIPEDIVSWSRQVPVLLAGLEARLDEVDKARDEVNQLIDNLRDGTRANFDKVLVWSKTERSETDKLIAVFKNATAKDKDNLLAACAEVKKLSAAWTERLRRDRQVLRAVRNRAMQVILDRPANGWDDAEGRSLRTLYDLTGRALSNRHYVEDDWRGEPVEHPFQREWWGNVF